MVAVVTTYRLKKAELLRIVVLLLLSLFAPASIRLKIGNIEKEIRF